MSIEVAPAATGELVVPDHDPQPITTAELVEQFDAMDAVKTRLATAALAAMSRPGAVVEIMGSRHVTVVPLSEIAAAVGVSIELGPMREQPDPLHDQATLFTVRCRVVRPDGVWVEEESGASTAETRTTREGRTYQRWTDAHAIMSMARTRAKVRALSTMLMPVVAWADRQVRAAGDAGARPATVSSTGAELMPPPPDGEE